MKEVIWTLFVAFIAWDFGYGVGWRRATGWKRGIGWKRPDNWFTPPDERAK